MKKCLLLKAARDKKYRVKVRVSDNWHPPFPDGTVEMRFDQKAGYISLWGDDDFGMEKYNCTRRDFEDLKGMVLSQDICKKLGFTQA